MVVPCSGEYNVGICTRKQFEQLRLNLVDILLEQTQGGRALASNSYWHGGRYASSLRLAPVGRLIRATHASPLRGAALRQHLAPIRPASFVRCAPARNFNPSDRLNFCWCPCRGDACVAQAPLPQGRLGPPASRRQSRLPVYEVGNRGPYFKAIGVGSDRRIWRGSAF